MISVDVILDTKLNQASHGSMWTVGYCSCAFLELATVESAHVGVKSSKKQLLYDADV